MTLVGSLVAAVLLVPGGPARAAGPQGFAAVNFAALVKRDNAPPAKRFTLVLFTTYATPHRAFSVSVPQRGGDAVAVYAGRNNKRFQEWHITKATPGSGGKLIRRIAKPLRRGRSVRFTTHTTTEGATGPLVTTCVIEDLNVIGPTCDGMISPQRLRPTR
jgi:hypothetical protein